MIYELLSDEEMKALPRQVGRMKHEQAYALMAEMDRLQKEHEAMIVRPTPRKGYHLHDPVPASTFQGCLHCQETRPWREIDEPCAEMVAIKVAIKDCHERGVLLSEGMVHLSARDKHQATCEECTFKDMHYDGYSSCPYATQLWDRWRIYEKRVSHIERELDIKRWEQATGRTYSSKSSDWQVWIDLQDWLDAGNKRDYREQK